MLEGTFQWHSPAAGEAVVAAASGSICPTWAIVTYTCVELYVCVHLQQKLCAGANRLSSCLLPTPTADGLAFNDLPLSSVQHQQQPGQQQRSATPAGSSSSSKVWQFGFSLLRATHVGPTGFESQRQLLYRVARVCIFDKANHRFLGELPLCVVCSSGAVASSRGAVGWHKTQSPDMLQRICCVLSGSALHVPQLARPKPRHDIEVLVCANCCSSASMSHPTSCVHIWYSKLSTLAGNVHALPVSGARAGKGGTWSWDAAGSSSMLTSATRKPRADLIPAGELAGSAASVAAAATDRGGLLGAVVEPGTEALAGGLAGAGGANSFVVRCAQVSSESGSKSGSNIRVAPLHSEG